MCENNVQIIVTYKILRMTANNESIDPNSLRRHIYFCLLVERNKHWVSGWYLIVLYFWPHHYGTATHPESCKRTYVGHALYQNIIEYKKYRKHRVVNSCAMESVWLTRHKVKSCDQNAGHGVYNLLFCIVCPAPQVNRNQCGAWVSLGLSIHC